MSQKMNKIAKIIMGEIVDLTTIQQRVQMAVSPQFIIAEETVFFYRMLYLIILIENLVEWKTLKRILLFFCNLNLVIFMSCMDLLQLDCIGWNGSVFEFIFYIETQK